MTSILFITYKFTAWWNFLKPKKLNFEYRQEISTGLPPFKRLSRNMFYRRRSAPISSADDASKNCQHKRSPGTLTQSALSTQFVWSTKLLRKHITIELHFNYGNSS